MFVLNKIYNSLPLNVGFEVIQKPEHSARPITSMFVQETRADFRIVIKPLESVTLISLAEHLSETEKARIRFIHTILNDNRFGNTLTIKIA